MQHHVKENEEVLMCIDVICATINLEGTDVDNVELPESTDNMLTSCKINGSVQKHRQKTFDIHEYQVY